MHINCTRYACGTLASASFLAVFLLSVQPLCSLDRLALEAYLLNICIKYAPIIRLELLLSYPPFYTGSWSSFSARLARNGELRDDVMSDVINCYLRRCTTSHWSHLALNRMIGTRKKTLPERPGTPPERCALKRPCIILV